MISNNLFLGGRECNIWTLTIGRQGSAGDGRGSQEEAERPCAMPHLDIL